MAALIAELIHLHLGNAKILEIGPGNGLTAFLLQQQNFNIDIVDASWETCQRIMGDYKINSWPSRFEDSEPSQVYDFIYAGHVIEHSEYPLDFFSKIQQALKDNGLFFFDTPDTHYFRKHGLEWKHFHTRHPYEHCCLFSMQTVEYIAKVFNLEVVSTESLPQFESMQILLRKK